MFNLVYNTVVRTKSPVESLFLEKIQIGKNNFVYHRGNDVALLFNQIRLEKSLGIDTINHWIMSLQGSDRSDLERLRSKLTDEQLLSFVKSRHLQSPSELLLWSEYLENLTDEQISSYKAELDKVDVEPVSVDNVSSESK